MNRLRFLKLAKDIGEHKTDSSSNAQEHHPAIGDVERKRLSKGNGRDLDHRGDHESPEP
jgi:hypothetical protein